MALQLGSVVIVVVVAAATSASILLYIGSIAAALSHHNVYNDKLQSYLAKVNGGEPENILILGSDKRANLAEDPGRSDTTILLRLDPDRNAIAVMSIPRDLKVEIPGFGTEKFNAAYTYGGPKLTLQVVKELTGLPINHVVNVDFLGFVRAVDAIGCVYTDVDRRYYHSNVGVPPSEQYSEINIKPGYQLLCGKKALQYVRYRHTDTDIVRSARQQDFLSAARERVPISDLVLDQNELIDIFTKYTTSDISDSDDDAAGAEALRRLAQRGDQGGPLPGRTRAQLRLRLAGRDPRSGRQVPRQRSERRPARVARQRTRWHRARKARRAAPRSKKKPKPTSKPKPPGSDGLVPAREAGELEAEGRRAQGQRRVPRLLPDAGCPPAPSTSKATPTNTIQDPRVYHLKDTDGKRHGAYRMVVELRTLRRYPLLRRAGDPGLGGPADPRQPEPDQDDQRPRIRHLRRRRPDKAGRLASGRQHLLGLQQPAPDPDQRPDGRHRPLGEGEDPQPEAKKREEGENERGAASRSA